MRFAALPTSAGTSLHCGEFLADVDWTRLILDSVSASLEAPHPTDDGTGESTVATAAGQ